MTNNTDPVREQRARDLLAAEYERDGLESTADRARSGDLAIYMRAPFRAIVAALASAPPSAPVGMDLSNWAQHYSIGPDALDALRNLLSLAQQPAAPVLAKHQPCGCVICTCEDEQQCQGCGAKHCGNRADHPPYVGQQPAAPSGEAVAWLRMKPDGTPDWAEDCIGSDDRFLDHELASDGYYLQPLYAAPQQPAGVGEAAAVLADLHPFLFGLKLAAPNEEKRAFIQERIDAVRRASAALAAQQQGGAK